MSWNSDIHELMGESQSDPDAIDKIVDALQEGGKGIPNPKNKRYETFGEIDKSLGAYDVEPRADTL